MIRVKVTQTNEIKVFEACSRLAEAQESAAARIDQGPCPAVYPDEVACRCPAVVGDGSTRTQHLEHNTRIGPAAACRRRRCRQGGTAQH